MHHRPVQHHPHRRRHGAPRRALLCIALAAAVAGCGVQGGDGARAGGESPPTITVPNVPPPPFAPTTDESGPTSSPTTDGSTTTDAPTTRRSTSTTTTAAPKAPKAVVAGWKTAIHGARHVAYDVPPDWKVQSPGVIVGYEDANGPISAMSAASSFRDGYCAGKSGSNRAIAGVPATQPTGGLATEANRLVQLWAKGVSADWSKARTTFRAAAPTVLTGGVKGQLAVATIEPNSADRCDPPVEIVVAVTFRSSIGTSGFVLTADQGPSDAAPRATVDRIVRTVRAA